LKSSHKPSGATKPSKAPKPPGVTKGSKPSLNHTGAPKAHKLQTDGPIASKRMTSHGHTSEYYCYCLITE
jgi:hypothetical protein